MNNNLKDVSLTADESPHIFKLLVESVRDYAIFLLDTDGVVCSWNQGAQRSKLYTADEIIGQNFTVFYTSEDRIAGLPQKLLKIALDEGRVENEGWRVRKDGTLFWADVVLTAIYNQNGQHIGFAKVTRDLTERRHLTIAREEAIRASSTKSAFLANMSHELRTPLTAIIGYAELIKEELQEIDPEALKNNLNKILFSGQHLLSIISDILDLSKIEAGELELHKSPVDLPQVIKDVTETVAPLATRNDNKIETSIEPEIPRLISDGPRLRQILYNLLSNAAKFTHSGTITVSAYSSKPEVVVIQVKDTGVGMSEDETATIFDRFSQVEAHVSSLNRGGTGLGLAICKMLSEAMGGTIYVKSSPGMGSTFTLQLPITDSNHTDIYTLTD